MQVDHHAYASKAESARLRFRAALPRARSLQAEVLQSFLTANAETSFGREHGFASLRDARDFRRAVPIRSYEELLPWLQRCVAGEPRVLTADAPAVFVTSSGTTGFPKRLPLTPTFVERCFLPFFFAAVGNALRHCPSSLRREDATLNMKWDPLHRHERTAGGTPAMGASQIDFMRQFGQALACEPGTHAPWARVPADIEDELERIYYRLRLAAESDVRVVIGINPAMVAALPGLLERWWERLLRDVHDGTMSGQPLRAANPQRAQELARAAAAFGAPLPAALWPRVEAIYCWTGGAAKIYTEELRRAFGPGVQMLSAPLAASEAPVALPIDRHPTAGILFVEGVYYEFVEADQELKADSESCDLSEVRQDREYHVVCSHVGGLYRYALGDVVRVVDFVQGVPRVEYACRNRGLRCPGAYVRESQLVDAVSGALAQAGARARGFVANLAGDGTLRVAVEPGSYLTPDELEQMAVLVDAQLAQRNTSYRAARQVQELAAPQVGVLPRGSLFADWCERVSAGVRPTQVKDRIFVDDATWSRLHDQAVLS